MTDTIETIEAAVTAVAVARTKIQMADIAYAELKAEMRTLEAPGWNTNRIMALIKKAAPMIAKLGGAGGIAGIATALAADEGAFSGFLSKVFGFFG